MLLQELIRRKFRTSAMITAVAIVTALLLSIQSINDGLRDELLSRAYGYNDDILITTEGSQGIYNAHTLRKILLNDKNISVVSPVLEYILSLYIPEHNVTLSMIATGIIPDSFNKLLGFELKKNFPEYPYFSDVYDELYYSNGTYNGKFSGEVLIPDTIAVRYGLKKNSEVYLSRTPLNDFITFKVVGIYKSELKNIGSFEKLLNRIYLHLSELQSIVNLSVSVSGAVIDAVDKIELKLQDDVRVVSLRVEEIRKKISDEYPFYIVSSKKSRIEETNRQIAIANGFYLGIGSITLLIGLLFVMAIMITRVIEGRGNIALMRALGISRSTIFKIIFMETFTILIIGVIIGISVALLFSTPINLSLQELYGLDIEFSKVSPQLVGLVVIEILLSGIVISIYPAILASRTNIIEIIREGEM